MVRRLLGLPLRQIKMQDSSWSLHNFLNENTQNLDKRREKKLKNEVIKVNIGVKRHCGNRNLETKTAVQKWIQQQTHEPPC